MTEPLTVAVLGLAGAAMVGSLIVNLALMRGRPVNRRRTDPASRPPRPPVPQTIFVSHRFDPITFNPIEINVNVSIHHVYDDGGPNPAVTQADLTALETRLMSALSDGIAAATASATALIGRTQTDLATLTAKVAELQALVDAGGASPADIQALADLKSLLDASDPGSPVILTPALAAKFHVNP